MVWQIFILSSLFLIKETHTATNVGGVLLDNTVWTIAGNPYNLINDVHVPRNATLTIQQGVRINFQQGDFEILVKGFIKVQGTPTQRVIFEGGLAYNTKPIIKFQSTQLSLSSIVYGLFNGPKSALLLAAASGGLTQNSGTLSIVSSSFLGNTLIQVQGVSQGTELELRSCSLTNTIVTNTNNGYETIRIISSNIFYSKLSPKCIDDCIYVHNCTVRHSIVEYDYGSESSRVTFDNSNAANTTLTSVNWWGGWNNAFIVMKSVINDFKIERSYGGNGGSANVTFEDSTLYNVSTIGYDPMYGESRLTCGLHIRRCRFTLGDMLVDYSQSFYYSPIVLSITDSRLTKVNFKSPVLSNVHYNSQVSLYMRNVSFVEGSILFPFGNADIAYSTITLTSSFVMGGNSQISCSSIGRAGTVVQESSVGIVALGLTITNSTLKNFATGIQVSPSQTNQVTISKTNFLSNSVYNIENKGAYNVTATGNYWGTNNGGVIVGKIYDYWDNINYGDVIYTNYTSTSLSAETGCPAYVADT